MVVFDATILLALWKPDIPPPRDPNNGNKPVDRFRDRIDYLVEQLERDRTKIIIPTPALSEILVHAGDAGRAYLSLINSANVFRPVDFDQRAAVEVAALAQEALAQGDKKGGEDASWAKIKYDRQIIAIAKVEGANTIYSDDNHIAKLGRRNGITVIKIADLPLPPEDPQKSFDLENPTRPAIEPPKDRSD